MTSMVVALTSVVEALDAGNVESSELVRRLPPSVSANLCEAVSQIASLDSAECVDVSASWALRYPPPIGPSSVRIERRHAEGFSHVARQLRPPRHDEEDRFLGFVAELRGVPDGMGGVEGEIAVRLFVDDDTSALARAHVPAAIYKVAHDAHGKNQLVEVTGKLERRARVHRLVVKTLRPV